MSGFAITHNRGNKTDVEKMMKTISHRGSYIQNIREFDKSAVGQNYLRADSYGATPDAIVPVADPKNPGLCICYDGQINDCRELCDKFGIEVGPFMEERLLLHLYNTKKEKMLQELGDAIFAFVITDGNTLFAARDTLGIKTLFYTHAHDGILLASELKAIAAISKEVLEFPAGHYMDQDGNLTHYNAVTPRMDFWDKDIDIMKSEIREIIEKHVRSTVDFQRPTAGLLSGGMDSSVINYISSKIYKEINGENGKLKTFSIGVGESEDIKNARLMSNFIGSEHYEMLITVDDLLKAMPEVIYYLENFDPSLVRSSVSNYLISKYASDIYDIEILLSGEGGDEIFCGYTYLKQFSYDEMPKKQIECLEYLHNNASLRLDRMNQCNSVKVIAPLISGELLDYALRIPPQYKQYDDNGTRIEKWIFRKAYEGILPAEITKRTKQEFSQGSGSADVLSMYFDDKVSDADFLKTKTKFPIIRSKEEYYYFKLFTDYFGEEAAVPTVGQWISL